MLDGNGRMALNSERQWLHKKLSDATFTIDDDDDDGEKTERRISTLINGKLLRRRAAGPFECHHCVPRARAHNDVRKILTIFFLLTSSIR